MTNDDIDSGDEAWAQPQGEPRRTPCVPCIDAYTVCYERQTPDNRCVRCHWLKKACTISTATPSRNNDNSLIEPLRELVKIIERNVVAPLEPILAKMNNEKASSEVGTMEVTEMLREIRGAREDLRSLRARLPGVLRPIPTGEEDITATCSTTAEPGRSTLT